MRRYLDDAHRDRDDAARGTASGAAPTPPSHGGPLFYTVAEVAEVLRVDRATIYRAIRDDGFPAERIRTRYVIPSGAVEQLAALAADTRGCVDVAALAAERRTTCELRRRVNELRYATTVNFTNGELDTGVQGVCGVSWWSG